MQENSYQSDESSIITESMSYLKEGNKSKALSILLDALKRYPSSYKIPQTIGEIFFNSEVYDLALKYYEISYKNGNQNVEIIEKLGECNAFLNKNKKAIKYFALAFSMGNSDPYYLYSLIWILLKEKKFEQAQRYLDIGFSLYGDLSYFTGAQALLFANTFQIDKAREFYAKVLTETASYTPVYFYNWGVMEYEIKNYRDAEQLFHGAASFGGLAEAFLALGELELLKVDTKAAEAAFLKGKPSIKSPFILYDLLSLYGFLGNKSKIESIYRNIKKYPNQWWIYQYNLNLNEQMMNFYELEKNYFSTYIILESKTYYQEFTQILGSKIKTLYFKGLKLLSDLKFRYSSLMFLLSVDKKDEPLTFYKTARNAVSGFKMIEKKLCRSEMEIFRKISPHTSSIYWLDLAKLSSKKSKKLQYIDLFLKNCDNEYDRMSILEALDLKARIFRKDKNTYCDILFQMASISTDYFNSNNIKIPVKFSYEEKNKEIKTLLRYFQTKGIIQDKNSPIHVQISFKGAYTVIVSYNGNDRFFSFVKEDITYDRLKIYSNFFGLSAKNK
jgi:Tfp pilus assembly protein PilF